MANYSDAVKEHALVVLDLYKNKVSQIQSVSGLRIFSDGTVLIHSPSDVKKYLSAIKTVCGSIPYVSAKLMISNAIRKLNLPPLDDL